MSGYVLIILSRERPRQGKAKSNRPARRAPDKRRATPEAKYAQKYYAF
jgi:hypothetical protein